MYVCVCVCVCVCVSIYVCVSQILFYIDLWQRSQLGITLHSVNLRKHFLPDNKQ